MTEQNGFSDSTSSSTSFQSTEAMLKSLKQTRPWARLIAVIGFISLAFMVISSLVNILAIGKITEKGIFVMVSGLYLVIGLLYFFPSYYLYKYASSITRLLDGGGAVEMETALSYQKSFWKFTGILVLLSVVVALLGIVAAIIIPRFV